MVDVYPVSIDGVVFLGYIFKVHIDLEAVSLGHFPLVLGFEPKGDAGRLDDPVGDGLPGIVPDGELIDVDVVGLVVVEDDAARRGDELDLIADQLRQHLFVGCRGVALAEVYFPLDCERTFVFHSKSSNIVSPGYNNMENTGWLGYAKSIFNRIVGTAEDKPAESQSES